MFPNVLTFVCDEGYEISGSSISECQANGLWSSPSVQCNGKFDTMLATEFSVTCIFQLWIVAILMTLEMARRLELQTLH